jgi:hypothetical protein
LNILSGLLNNRRGYYKVTKYKLIKIGIRRSILLDEPMKNRILFILLNVFNIVKNRYFRVIFIIILRALIFFKKKIGVLLKKRAIKQKSYPVLITGYVLIIIRASSWILYKILLLLILQKVLLKIFKNKILYIFNSPYIRPI